MEMDSPVRVRFATIVLVPALVLAGAAGAAGPPAPATRRPLGADLPAYEARSDDAHATPPVSEPRGVIGLRDALAAALLANPDLGAAAWDVRAREARALQAGALPNPTFDTELEDFGGSGERRGWHSAQTTLSLSQLVELGGKRAKRRRAAELEQQLGGWDYEQRRLDVLTRTTQEFVDVLALQERLAVARDDARIAAHTVSVVAGHVRMGAVPVTEQARAEVASARAQLAAEVALRDLAAARSELAAMWGATAPTFDAVQGDLDRLVPPPSPDRLREHLTANPDLARWDTEIATHRARLDLELASRVPDVTVSIGGRHFAESEDTALVAGFSVPLPLFDRNQGNVLAARRALSEAEFERRSAATGLSARLSSVLEKLRTDFERARALRDRILPAAERARRGADEAYAKGLFRLVEVLDAQRVLADLRNEYLEAAAAYHQDAAELERLTGTPLATISAPEGTR
jgi:cobalt-zinc-cadmium efflux system outer membrane protein